MVHPTSAMNLVVKESHVGVMWVGVGSGRFKGSSALPNSICWFLMAHRRRWWFGRVVSELYFSSLHTCAIP
jgi:hypothetical protein